MKLTQSLSFLALAATLSAFPAQGCAAQVEGNEQVGTSDSAITRRALVAKIKAAWAVAYAAGVYTSLPGEHDVNPATLPGQAKTDYDGYKQNYDDGLVNSGEPLAHVATVDGATVFFVTGDVSDTGTEFGFYDAHGKLIAQAYSGQGEVAGADGVDWTL